MRSYVHKKDITIKQAPSDCESGGVCFTAHETLLDENRRNLRRRLHYLPDDLLNIFMRSDSFTLNDCGCLV